MTKPGKMMGEIVRNFFKHPATTMYPFVKRGVPEGFRGRISFNPSLCFGCKICSRDCPSGAIEIVRLPGEEKRFNAVMRLDRCIYCSQCVDGCPKKALSATQDFELASLDKDNLLVDFNDPAR